MRYEPTPNTVRGYEVVEAAREILERVSDLTSELTVFAHADAGNADPDRRLFVREYTMMGGDTVHPTQYRNIRVRLTAEVRKGTEGMNPFKWCVEVLELALEALTGQWLELENAETVQPFWQVTEAAAVRYDADVGVYYSNADVQITLKPR